MHQTRTLPAAEIRRLLYGKSATRAQIAHDYDVLLASFTVGDYRNVAPQPGETLLAVRRRLSAAARRRGWRLVFLPTYGKQLIFQVREVFGV